MISRQRDPRGVRSDIWGTLIIAIPELARPEKGARRGERRHVDVIGSTERSELVSHNGRTCIVEVARAGEGTCHVNVPVRCYGDVLGRLLVRSTDGGIPNDVAPLVELDEHALVLIQ